MNQLENSLEGENENCCHTDAHEPVQWKKTVGVNLSNCEYEQVCC